jgi:uncharacterized membrane protein YfcA
VHLPDPDSYTRRVARNLLTSTGIGVAAGFVGGLFGVGGGVIVVPGLILFLGIDQIRASATSTATIAAAAAGALVLFGSESAVDLTAAGWLVAGAVVGAALGARYVDRVPTVWLTRGFAALMLIAAVRMWLA